MKTGNPPFQPWLGVFETLRVVRGRALFLEEHWLTLQESAQALGLAASADLRKQVSALPREDGRWRWIVTPEGTRDLFQPEEPEKRKTFTLALSAQRIGSENWDARHKTLSYLTHWQARQAARAADADEAVLLNEHGEIATGAMTNLFWVADGKLHTPPPEAGCRSGVVRQWVLGQTEVAIGSHPLPSLDGADEIFVTNSLIGIMPVSRFGDRNYPTGPVTSALLQKYRAAIGESTVT